MSAERDPGADVPTEVDLTAVPTLSVVDNLDVIGDIAKSSHRSGGNAGTSSGSTDMAGSDSNDDTDNGRAYDDAWLLVRRTQDGDAEAFGLLYDRYVDTIYRFVYYRLGDRTEAEDLTSETFVRALRRISTVHEQGRDIGAWLVTIARNLVLDHVKSAQYRLSIPTAEILDSHAEIHQDAHRDAQGSDYPNADTTEGGALAALDQRALLEAVSRLSPEQQESIVLRFFQGLSLAETAEIMGRNAGAVKALQHRAMRRLQVLLTEPAPTRPSAPAAEDPRTSEVRRLPGRGPPPPSHRVTRDRKRYRPRSDG